MMPNGQQPIFIMQQGTTQEKGRAAQSNNIAAARAVAQAVRTTLGPMGMDKMLVDEGGDVIITNDGATILREIDIDHPAAKMIIEVAKTQEQECYDGTTSAVILAGELLKRSEDLIDQNIHPTTICRGFRKAGAFVLKNLPDYDMDEIDLLSLAKTSLTGKSADSFKDELGQICVDVVERLSINGIQNANLEDINVVKAVGGSAGESILMDSIILDKAKCHSGMPSRIESPRILVVESSLGVKQTEMEANIQITDPAQMEDFLAKEEAYLEGLAKKIIALGEAKVVVCQREIDDLVKYHLAQANIMAIEKVKKSTIDSLVTSTGATLLSNLDSIDVDCLGDCKKVEEKKIGEHIMIFVDYPKNSAVTLLLRGGTHHFVDEIERAFDDAVGVVSLAHQDMAVLTGGGSSYAALSHQLNLMAPEIEGRERMAVQAFARALEVIPRTLADNAGLDPVNEMMLLMKCHAEGEIHFGIDIENGGSIDMREAGVFEPRAVVEQALKSALETAIMILRIDDVISSKKA
tara:strand:- start:1101 stop:2663 length:1563 start_codon:yes stop_codon:yes gene_type:complete